MQAIGMVETKGLVAAIDLMLKYTCALIFCMISLPEFSFKCNFRDPHVSGYFLYIYILFDGT